MTNMTSIVHNFVIEEALQSTCSSKLVQGSIAH